MTFILEREFDRKGGLRAHGSKYTKDGRVKRHIKSGRQIILHRLSEDIMTSNVFGILEKLDPKLWLKPLLLKYFYSREFPELISDSNYEIDAIQYHFWCELGKPKRPWTPIRSPARIGSRISGTWGSAWRRRRYSSPPCSLWGRWASRSSPRRPAGWTRCT